MTRTGTYYLNNRGDRWVQLVDGKRVSIELRTWSGKVVRRKVEYFESFGNFAVACISYKGEKRKVLLDEILDD